MKAIIIILVLLCCLAMFWVKRKYKIAILFLGSMVFSIVEIPVIPFHAANSILPMAYLLSEWRHLAGYIRLVRKTIVWRVACLAVLLVVLALVSSPHLRDFTSIKGFVMGELFFKYFAILYAFWSCSDDESLRPVLQMTLIGLLALTFFGVINQITQNAFFLQEVYSGSGVVGMKEGAEIGEMYTERERFRVQSMFINPFDYGYICLVVLLLHSYAFNKKLETKIVFLLVIVCSVYGIVACACRTVFFCMLLGIGSYILFAFKVGKTLRSIIILTFIAILSYNTIPAVQEKVDSTFTMFEKNSNVGGSSLEMRYLQYAAVLYYVEDSPIFGKGYSFFYEDMGWKNGPEGLRDYRLYGLEGVVMNYILERGFVGLAIYLFIYISLLMYCIKIRKKDKHLSALGGAVIVVYLSFANMTGELLSVYPTLLCLGLVVRISVSGSLPPPIEILKEWIERLSKRCFPLCLCNPLTIARA